MSGIVTAGEVAAAAGDAYGAYQGGLSTPANQASFGAAVAAGAAAPAHCHCPRAAQAPQGADLRRGDFEPGSTDPPSILRRPSTGSKARSR